MLDMCETCYFTDIVFLANTFSGVLWNSSYFKQSSLRVGGLHYMDYLVREAAARNIRVHAWITIGYWRGMWANRNAGCPDSWNCATLSNWDHPTYGDWVNLGRSDVQESVGAAVADIRDHIPGLAGVSLDYIRLQPAMELKDGRLTGEHVTECVRRAATEIGDQTLTATGVPLWAKGWKGYNFDIYGCSQDWPGWIQGGLVDYVLPLNYYGADQLESMLTNHYDPLPDEVRARMVDIVAPTAIMEDDRVMGVKEWERLLAINEAHGYDLGVYDDSLLTVKYQPALQARPISKPPWVLPEDIKEELQLASTQLADRCDALGSLTTSLSALIDSLDATAAKLEGAAPGQRVAILAQTGKEDDE
jgi:hypothetical protein